jgi:hypothetical protein
MKRSEDPWSKLASAARRAPDGDRKTVAVDPLLADAIAAKSMQVAALGQPSLKTVVLAWILSWKVLIPVLVLLLGSTVWWAGPGNFGRPTLAERYDGWGRDTVRQLRAWLPMECDQAGQITVLMQERIPALKALPPGSAEAKALIEQTRREIDALLSVEQRAAFAAEQDRLRAKWLPAPSERR